MKKIVWGILFLALSAVGNNSSANDLVGYWVKHRVKQTQNGQVSYYDKVQELIAADVENNQYTIQTTKFDLDGNIDEVSEEITDRFATPEDGAKVVKDCETIEQSQRGVRTFGTGTIETCDLIYDGIIIFTVAAVPFGVFEFSFNFEMENPNNGEMIYIESTSTLTDFGKK